MGKKYIIELLDDCPSEFKGIIVFGLTPEGQIAAEPIPVEDLTPYTEPDLKQVRKEGYQQGLSDAWEAARKVTQVRKYGGYGDCLEEVFGRHRVPWDVFDYSASEAIEKIRQYEQEKDRQARIEYNFDEIKDVLETTAKECNVSLDEIAEVLQKMKES